METWRWIEPLSEDGSLAMDRDREFFEQVKNRRSDPILRFYTWPVPSLSYGRTQGIDPVSKAEAEEKGWTISKRPTGGGKVFHCGDLCFTLIWRKETMGMPWNIRDSYCAIHRWIKISLKGMRIDTECVQSAGAGDRGWCFSSPVEQDLLLNGKKIVGGAQWRDGKSALHQGSIQLQGILPELDLFKGSFCELFFAGFQ